MKFERERDIPALKGKTWRERMALRDRASERDRSIYLLRLVCGVGIGLIFASTMYLMRRLVPHVSLFVVDLVFAALAYVFAIVFYGLFITPRIRRALEPHEKSSA
jgi:hypothetical protein